MRARQPRPGGGRQPLAATRRSNNGNNRTVPAVAWRILQASFAVAILVWIGTAFNFLARSDEDRDDVTNGLRDNNSHGTNNENAAAAAAHGTTPRDEALDMEHGHVLALDLEVAADLNDDKGKKTTTITIRISVMADRCPKAYEFLKWMVDEQESECRPCTIYRGEPVPSYWGSEEYPNRWDNGGRWGPPYALVQGGFLNSRIKHIEREGHRPKLLERGMVAWAGTSGVHFFVALADHPEWGDEHTVWGRVMEEEDMAILDRLVVERPLVVLEHNVPVVTNFAHPMPFRMREL